MPILDKRLYRERDPWREKIINAAREKRKPSTDPEIAKASSWEPPRHCQPPPSEQLASPTEVPRVEETRPLLTFFMAILIGATVFAVGLAVVELAWLDFILESLSN
jgi:hypothetical protein